MKIIITESQCMSLVKQQSLNLKGKTVTEEIRNKTEFGRGKEHVVYDFEKDPTKVIKTGWNVKSGYRYDPNSEKIFAGVNQDHIKMFIKYPNLFPKVYKHNEKYAVIEKMNTDRVVAEQAQLYQLLKSFELNDLYYMKEHDTISSLYWNVTKRSGFMKKIINRMERTHEDVSLLVKYLELFKVINGTLKRAVKSFGLDIGQHNMGYDPEGNLKLFDY